MDEPEYSGAERLAAVAGIVFGLVLLVVSVDVASGGRLSAGRVARYRWEQAAGADSEAEL